MFEPDSSPIPSGSANSDDSTLRAGEGTVTSEEPMVPGFREVQSQRLLTLTPSGLYCEPGDFYIDPWRPVKKAILTHGHSDHARWGSDSYLAVHSSERILRHRLGASIHLNCMSYGECENIHGVRVTFHPAGHILGSAQVRLEYRGYVAVVTGDFKREADPTCESFEPVRCHLMVTESTFGLPVFRWPRPLDIATEINTWWRTNASLGKTSLLFAYGLGKSQRLLSMIDPDIGPIYLHGAVAVPTELYREHGVSLPETRNVSQADKNEDWSRALVIAVPSAHHTTWTQRFRHRSTAMASGWMLIRGNRRRRNVDRGFVLSDHADWPGLLQTVADCQPEQVWCTHGFADVYSRYLVSQNVSSVPLRTEFVGESLESTQGDEA